MSDSDYNNTIQFRGPEKEAAELLDTIHLGGINLSELARTGLQEMLRRSASDEDKITIYELYDRGELDDEVARILLGDEIDHVKEETAAFKNAMDRNTSAFLVR